ncbi:hypothetical protein [Streptomyces sp. NPDC058401]|uniref:hypothetical protein n=1 Tax=Streptomyces sp. NPDC058401 TaxID=3346480 RepID=UPI00365C88EB
MGAGEGDVVEGAVPDLAGAPGVIKAAAAPGAGPAPPDQGVVATAQTPATHR